MSVFFLEGALKCQFPFPVMRLLNNVKWWHTLHQQSVSWSVPAQTSHSISQSQSMPGSESEEEAFHASRRAECQLCRSRYMPKLFSCKTSTLGISVALKAPGNIFNTGINPPPWSPLPASHELRAEQRRSTGGNRTPNLRFLSRTTYR